MDDYIIIKKIGSGSYATVYLAQKEQNLYALKVINKTDITADYEQKLNNEIRILKVLIKPLYNNNIKTKIYICIDIDIKFKYFYI